jgi:hypothetical protein
MIIRLRVQIPPLALGERKEQKKSMPTAVENYSIIGATTLGIMTFIITTFHMIVNKMRHSA